MGQHSAGTVRYMYSAVPLERCADRAYGGAAEGAWRCYMYLLDRQKKNLELERNRGDRTVALKDSGSLMSRR